MMNSNKPYKQKQIHDIEETLAEIRDHYNQIHEKIFSFDEATPKGPLDNFLLEADGIIQAIKPLEENLEKKTLKEIDKIKILVSKEFQKISELNSRVEKYYQPESAFRDSVDDDIIEISTLHSPKRHNKNLTLDLDDHTINFERLSALNYDTTQKAVLNKNFEEDMKNLIISPFSSALPTKKNHEILGKFDDGISFPSKDSVKTEENKLRSLIKPFSKKGLDPIKIPKVNTSFLYIKEVSNYDLDLSPVISSSKQLDLSRQYNQSETYIEEDKKVKSKSKLLDSPYKTYNEFENFNSNPLPFFKENQQLFDLTQENEGGKNSKAYLWKYIFCLQEKLLTNLEYTKQRISDLEKEVIYKDEIIQQLLRQRTKLDINEEAKYYENFKLIHNPQKIVSLLKSGKYYIGQKAHQTSTHSRFRSIIESPLNCMFPSNQDFDQGSYKTPVNGVSKKFYGLFDNGERQKTLGNASTNLSFDLANPQSNFSCKPRDMVGQETIFSTGDSYYSDNFDDDLNFTNPCNMRAYMRNLQETVEVMKENNKFIKAENDQLKQIIENQKKRIATLEKENERIRMQRRAIAKSKDFDSFEGISAGGFKWSSAKKFLELEQKNKDALSYYKNIFNNSGKASCKMNFLKFASFPFEVQIKFMPTKEN